MRKLLALGAISILAAGSAAAGIVFTVGAPQPLGAVDGVDYSYGMGVNSHGTVAGIGTATDPSTGATVYTPLRSTAGGAPVKLSYPQGWRFVQAFDISENDIVVGIGAKPGQCFQCWGAYSAVMWDASGKFIELGPYFDEPQQLASSNAQAISPSGRFIVGHAVFPDNVGYATRWDGGVPQPLPSPSCEEPCDVRVPDDVNDAGDVVGSVHFASGAVLPVLWRNGTAKVLETGLETNQFTTTGRMRITNSGEVYGSVYDDAGTQTWLALRWDASGTPSVISTVPSSEDNTAAVGASGLVALRSKPSSNFQLYLDGSYSAMWEDEKAVYQAASSSTASGSSSKTYLAGWYVDSTTGREQMSRTLVTTTSDEEPPPPNKAPIATLPSLVTGTEGSLLRIFGTVTDEDGPGPLTYEWDLDGNGTFERSSSASDIELTPADNYTGRVGFRAMDGAGAMSAAAYTTVEIQNVAPSVQPGSDISTSTGQSIRLDARFGDPGTDAPWQYSVDWGDGSPASTGSLDSPSASISPAHSYSTNGSFEVTVSVTDKDGGVGSGTLRVTIVNRAPVAKAGGPYTGAEGSAVTFDGSQSSDPDGDALTYAWSFGDGATATGATATHVYTDNGTYTVQLTVTDSHDAKTTATVQASIANVAPSVQPGSDISTSTGQSIRLDAHFGDPGTDANWQYSVNWGDGSPASTGALNSPSSPITPSHTYATTGSFEVTVSVTDKDGESGTGTLRVSVVNQAPVANAGGPYAGIEGSAVAFDGSQSSDPDGDALTYAWDFGDGATATGATATHVYADDGTYAVKLTVTDAHDAKSTVTAVATIANAAPVVGEIEGIPEEPITFGTPVTLSVSFTDATLADGHVGAVQWDITSSFTTAGVSTIAPSATEPGIVRATATLAPGVYTVSLRVQDKDGGTSVSSSAPDYIVVYDPTEGFVTGGGWIQSPTGACRLTTACGGSQGKATFGFVSKYLKGADTPSGNTEFTFQAGNLKFSAIEYEWLVVSGWKAQYKGAGRINGGGDYGFLLTALDGDLDSNGKSPDKFRIKIWNRATGVIVYDNQMNASDNSNSATTLSGGSIHIHKTGSP